MDEYHRARNSRNIFSAVLSYSAWMNITALANEQPFFSDIPETIKSNEKLWRTWYEHGSPEGLEIPNIEERLQQHKIGACCS